MKAVLSGADALRNEVKGSLRVAPLPPTSTRAPLGALLPHALVACWLAFLGAIIWQHVVHSVQSPLYDPLDYMQKAMNFWQALAAGRIRDALNAAPSSRPHGTILMSYPFGFSPDFQGFHFRSVFLPIMCSVAAVYVAAGMRVLRQAGWWVAAIAFLFSSLPLFYQFDWREPTAGPVRWGLVDNFQAGVAALSVAMLLRSLSAKSVPWLVGAALLSAVALLVKPSGLMIMALVAFLWAMMLAVEWLRSRRDRQSNAPALQTYRVRGAAVFLIVYAGVLVFCLFSGYFSRSNFLYARQALVVMQDLLQIQLWQTAALFHRSSGEALALWCIAIGLLIWQQRRASAATETGASDIGRWSALGSSVIWIAGAWYWLVVQSGGNQIRYFYPFLLMGVVWLLPAAFAVWPRAPRWARLVLMTVCFLPAINIGALLVAGDAPSIPWQKMSGVSVTVGADREEVNQANALLGTLRAANRSARLYSFGSGVLPAIFENVGMYEKLVRPELPVFHVTTPHNWVHGFVVRTDALINSDYILIRKYADRNLDALLAPSNLDTFARESRALEHWLSTLNEESGLETISDGTNLRLLRVSDSGAFARAIDRFVALHAWRPEFVTANRPTWWNAEALPESARHAEVRNVVFGEIFKLHALVVGRTNAELTIDVWWEELRNEPANAQRFLFLHLVDSSGAILLKDQIALFPYRPPDAQRRLRHDRVTFNVDAVRGKLASLGFGVYQPSGEYLLTESARSDYGGKRVLITLDGAAGATTGSSRATRP